MLVSNAVRSFYDLNYKDLVAFCELQGLPAHTARLLFNWHHKKNRTSKLEHQDLSLKAKQVIYSSFNFLLPEIVDTQKSPDLTVKFLLKLSDQLKVETVLIPFQGKYSVCLSSQVGCAMNCAFCFTGKQGFTRHLETHEIIGQFLQVKNWLNQNRPEDNKILNVVFMGQGEPLHNFDAVKKSCEILTSQFGLSLAQHKITVSTSGYVPGLERWKNEMPAVNIALSLHSAFNEKRSQLIPLNKKYPLEVLIPLVEAIPEGEKRFVTYEYLLIDEFNDGENDAKALIDLLKGTKAFLNLIPFNPIPESDFKRPSFEKVMKFKESLASIGVPVTVRTTKGDQILAACGQLNTKK